MTDSIISGLTQDQEDELLLEFEKLVGESPDKEKFFKNNKLRRSIIKLSDENYWILGKKLDNQGRKLDLKGRGCFGSVTKAYAVAFNDKGKASLTGEVGVIKSIVGYISNDQYEISQKHLGSQGFTLITPQERINNRSRLRIQAKTYLHMELYDGKNYHADSCELRRLKVYEFLDEIIAIVEDLKSLHKQDILHLDIKPDNIIRYEDHGSVKAKIIDMGYSWQLKGKAIASNQGGGDQRFKDPWLNQTGIASKASDIYSLGRSIEIISGYKKWKENELKRSSLILVRKLCKLMEQDNPYLRPDINFILSILKEMREREFNLQQRKEGLDEKGQLLQNIVFNQINLLTIQELNLYIPTKKADPIALNKMKELINLIAELDEKFFDFFKDYNNHTSEENLESYQSIISEFKDKLHNDEKNSGYKLFGQQRSRAKPIFFNTLISLTGIGLILIGINALGYKMKGKGTLTGEESPLFFTSSKTKTSKAVLRVEDTLEESERLLQR